tara:strand:- start:1456 stop:1605 length:150 start_codon:yes stop_codon:yes gene_type:complete
MITMPKTTHYYLRNIPLALWRRAKKRAKGESTTVRDLLLRFLASYAGKR